MKLNKIVLGTLSVFGAVSMNMVASSTPSNNPLGSTPAWYAAAQQLKEASINIKAALLRDENMYKDAAANLSYFGQAIAERKAEEQKLADCIVAKYQSLMDQIATCNANSDALSSQLYHDISELEIELTYQRNKAAEEIAALTAQYNNAKDLLAQLDVLYAQVIADSNEEAHDIINYLQAIADQWYAMLTQKQDFYTQLYNMSESINQHVADSGNELQDLAGSICH